MALVLGAGIGYHYYLRRKAANLTDIQSLSASIIYILVEMDPLSIAASITGIIVATTQVGGVLRRFVGSVRVSVQAVMMEMEHVRILCRALQGFSECAIELPHRRTALVHLEDLVVILTQIVVVFSELQELLEPFLVNNEGCDSTLQRIRWRGIEPVVDRLMDQLQSHKTSLSLLLQIVQWYAKAIRKVVAQIPN